MLSLCIDGMRWFNKSSSNQQQNPRQDEQNPEKEQEPQEGSFLVIIFKSIMILLIMELIFNTKVNFSLIAENVKFDNIITWHAVQRTDHPSFGHPILILEP